MHERDMFMHKMLHNLLDVWRGYMVGFVMDRLYVGILRL